MDVIGRYGGEEFIALLPETSLDGALQWAEKLRTEIQLESVSKASDKPISLTISVGITERRATDKKIEDLIGRADEALYAAKAAGRNRTCIASKGPPETPSTP